MAIGVNRIGLFWALAGVVASAEATAPTEIYERVRPSVLVLEALDEQGNPASALTAIAIGAGRAVSLCDALEDARSFRILGGKDPLSATIAARDRRRNLCLLAVPGLESPALTPADESRPIRAGARIYALSNAAGLGIGISEGVVAGIRSLSAVDYIQFTAPVSPGSEGGALVDSDGNLLGIIDYRHRDGQNVNFAVPAKWIAEIERQSEADQAYVKLREQAEKLFRAGSWKALKSHASGWIKRLADDSEAWRWLAVASGQLKDLEAEERAWRELRRLDPASTAAGAGLVRVMLRRGQIKDALESARSLLALSKEDAEIWTVIGQAEHAAGSLEKAEEAYNKAVSFNPWQTDAHIGLIALAEQRGKPEEVTAGWQRLARLYPDAPNIRFRLVEAYIQEGRPARAYSLLERLTGPDAESADTWLLKGKTLAALGRPLDAIQAYRRALEGKPTSKAMVHASLGKAYFDLKRFPESIAAYREAVRLEPANDQWRYGLALALKDGGRAEETLKIDSQLLKKYPKDVDLWRQMGFANAILARHTDSIKALERSLELEPAQGKVWSALIDEYHAAGRFADARKAYERLREIDGTWAEKSYRSTLAPYEEQQK